MFTAIALYFMFLLQSIFMISLIFGVKNNLIIYIGLPIIIFVFSLTNLITYDNNEVIVTKLRQLE